MAAPEPRPQPEPPTSEPDPAGVPDPNVTGVPGVLARLVAGLDHGVPQPLHVGQQARAGRIADDLPEEVAEQADVAPHQFRQLVPVPVPAPASIHVHVASVIPAGFVAVNLMP